MTPYQANAGGKMRVPSGLERKLIRYAAAAFSRSGDKGSLLVLIFHRVLAAPDPMLPDEPDAARFAALMDLVISCFRVLPLREAAQRLRDGSLPSRAVSVTFDDGYANNSEIAQPILSAKGIPATIFVSPGFLDGGRMFNDTIIETIRRARDDFDLRSEGLGRYLLTDYDARRRAVEKLLSQLKYLAIGDRDRRIRRIVELAGVTLPADLMMTSAQVHRLHDAGFEIGAHTIDHPILTSVDDSIASRQMAESKAMLETIIGAPVRSFAYPNGRPVTDYAARHVALARAAGFDLALSTAWGAATRKSDPLQIPRVAPWDRTSLRYGLRLAGAYRARSFAVA